MRVVGATSDDATTRGVPFDTVDGAGVALELDQRLTGLAHVEDADNV